MCGRALKMKTFNLPDDVHEDLVLISKELTAIAGKPISVGMAVALLMEVYRAHLSEPCARDAFYQAISRSNLMSPEEFEQTWDQKPSEKSNKPKKK
jgi:phage portal protein BeeE